MIRKAFLLHLLPGMEEEYVRRHNPIWPELQQVLIEHGVRKYGIFLRRDTGDLFAYAEIESEERWAAIAETEVCRRWWDHMKPLMRYTADGRPEVLDLEETFYLEALPDSGSPD